LGKGVVEKGGAELDGTPISEIRKISEKMTLFLALRVGREGWKVVGEFQALPTPKEKNTRMMGGTVGSNEGTRDRGHFLTSPR